MYEGFALIKRLKHTKIEIRYLLMNLVYYVIMKNFTRPQVPLTQRY